MKSHQPYHLNHVFFNLHNESDSLNFYCMKHKSFEKWSCPIARSLESVGDWWSMLIIRDAFHGLKRFDEFSQSLGIATNTLTRRLNHLVRQELLIKIAYQENPLRYEYHLSEKGRDFFPVLMTLFQWGEKHMPDNEVGIHIADRQSYLRRTVKLVDAQSGDIITDKNTILIEGPAADAGTKKRIQKIKGLYS